MAGFTSYDDLINAISANGQILESSYSKTGPTGEAAGVWHTLWNANGMPGVTIDVAGVATSISQPPAVLAISNATNATPIVVTTGTHSLNDGQSVYITGVGGNTAANGDFYVKRTGFSATTFALYTDYALTNPVAGNGAYTAGGSVNGTKRISSPIGLYYADQSPATKHILTFGAMSTQDCVVMLYDRLVDTAGFLTSSGAAQTVNTAPLPRYTDGIGVEAWIEMSVTGAGTPVMHLSSYIDNDGNAAQVGASVTLATTPLINSMYQLPLAAADKGVRAVSTLTVDTTGASGVFNVALIKPLGYLSLTSNLWNEKDFVLQLTSLPQVFDGGSLGIAYLASTITAPNFRCALRIGYN